MLRSFSSAAMPGNDTAATATTTVAAPSHSLIRFPAPPDRPAPRGIQPGEGARVNPDGLAAVWRRSSIARTMPLSFVAHPRIARFAGAVGVELRIAGPDPGFLRIHPRCLPISLVVPLPVAFIGHHLLPRRVIS